MHKSEKLTPLQAWERIKHYCAYSERCHSEVRSRLFDAGLTTIEVDELVSRLIEEDYLNEERFATQYTGGHFRQKKWGRLKIIHALKAKNVSEYCIKKGLREIDEEAYEALLIKLATQKWNSCRGQSVSAKWAKTRQFLVQKGFEPDLVYGVLKTIQKDE